MSSLRPKKSVKNIYDSYLNEKKFLSEKIKIKEEIQRKKENKQKQYEEYISSLKVDWKKDIFQSNEEIENNTTEPLMEKVNIPKKLKSDWRKEILESKEVFDESKKIKNNNSNKNIKIVKIKNKKISPKLYEHWDKFSWRESLINEGMSSKDFEYLYGLSISDIQINSMMSGVQSTLAQDILKASSDVTSYQFGAEFPGSFINSIGDNQITSQNKVDVVAFFDTSYGDVSGIDQSYRLTTGPEGFSPAGQSPPGSVVSRVNLEAALGISLPAGVPNGNYDGTPVEGSAIKRVFTDAKPGRRINFKWSFASSEDTLGEESVDDYAFVAIKGNVTKFVSVLTKGLKYGGEFIYTVQPEDIVDGKVEIGIGVIDVYDPYIQTVLNIFNFGSLWSAGTLGDTTDAADLGMSVAAADPNKKKKKKVSDVVKDTGIQKATGTFDISKMEKNYGEISQLRPYQLRPDGTHGYSKPGERVYDPASKKTFELVPIPGAAGRYQWMKI